MTSHVQKIERWLYKCNICGKSLKGSITCAKRHVETIHFPGTFEYKCDLCGEKLNSKNSLDYHKYVLKCGNKSKFKGQ